MNNRTKVFLIALNMMLAFFLLRLFQLQILDHAYYSQKATYNAAKVTPILAPRGIIFDRNGRVLLKNKPVFMLYMLPHLLPKDPSQVFNRLGSIINLPAAAIEQRLKEKKRPMFEGVLIASDIPNSYVSRIEEDRINLPGVEAIAYPLRSYAYKNTASHVLGYVKEIESNELLQLKTDGYRLGDLIGKDGVEKYYDKYLRGFSGGRKIEVDAYGKPVKILEIVEPIPGDNINLTVDIDLQKKVDEALGGNEGAVVVIDPRSGEILALASHPAYDPSKKWEKINNFRHPFMNRALSSYPPGSIFKAVTLSAALSEKKTNPEEIFNCLGFYKLGKRIAKCWLAKGHGRITPIEGLVRSCDIVFYELGRRLGPDTLYKYAAKYGLGQKTRIDLPQEKRGFVPDQAWKKERFNEGWYEGDSINMGTGQGFTQVTPLQMACLYGEIAVGKRFKPYIVKSIVGRDGKIILENKPQIVDSLDLNEKNLALIRGALRDIVRRGTGIAAYVAGFQASGKTGTAENPGRAHAWFVCYAPSDNPEIVISAFVAHGEHGDKVTAYIARDILEWYKENRLDSN